MEPCSLTGYRKGGRVKQTKGTKGTKGKMKQEGAKGKMKQEQTVIVNVGGRSRNTGPPKAKQRTVQDQMIQQMASRLGLFPNEPLRLSGTLTDAPVRLNLQPDPTAPIKFDSTFQNEKIIRIVPTVEKELSSSSEYIYEPPEEKEVDLFRDNQPDAEPRSVSSSSAAAYAGPELYSPYAKRYKRGRPSKEYLASKDKFYRENPDFSLGKK
jgi:hypothetical protein